VSQRILPVLPGSEKNVLPRLVIVPDIGAYFSDKPNWLEVTPTYLMNWTDFRQTRTTWCGLAIVAPELTAEQLYQQSMFQEAWKWWTHEQSQQGRHVWLTIKDERSGHQFTFGTSKPHVTARISIFGQEFFEHHRNPSSTISRLVVWEKILVTMMPGAEARVDDTEGTIEHWLDAGKIVLPANNRHLNPRQYEQALVLRYGAIMPKTSLYMLNASTNAATGASR
jgi:hypothetical protein